MSCNGYILRLPTARSGGFELRGSSIQRALLRVVQRADEIEAELNEADRHLGDGDTGTMYVRLIKAIADVDPNDEDVGIYLQDVAEKAAETTGSSLGNLITAAIRAVARRSKGRSELELVDLPTNLLIMRDAMMRVGGAEIGDKTVIDSLDRIAADLKGVASWEDVGSLVVHSARAALREFSGRPCRVGRARMFAEKSKEYDDPGMRLVYLTAELATQLEESTFPEMQKITRVKTGNPFEDKESFSRVVVVEKWIFTSNTAGRNLRTKEMPASAREQAIEAFNNVEAALKAVGSSLQEVVRSRVTIPDPKDVPEVMAVVGERFRGVDPASTVTCTPLALDYLKMELEVTAYRGAGSDDERISVVLFD